MSLSFSIDQQSQSLHSSPTVSKSLLTQPSHCILRLPRLPFPRYLISLPTFIVFFFAFSFLLVWSKSFPIDQQSQSLSFPIVLHSPSTVSESLFTQSSHRILPSSSPPFPGVSDLCQQFISHSIRAAHFNILLANLLLKYVWLNPKGCSSLVKVSTCPKRGSGRRFCSWKSEASAVRGCW